MNNVFTYGSLMFAPVWQKIVCGRYESVPASAPGLARYRVQSEPYPGAILSADGRTDGRVYFGVSANDCARLDQKYYFGSTKLHRQFKRGLIFICEPIRFLRKRGIPRDLSATICSDFWIPIHPRGST
jgi:Gamma-glutamyl cyclotransferase, AIG2-like